MWNICPVGSAVCDSDDAWALNDSGLDEGVFHVASSAMFSDLQREVCSSPDTHTQRRAGCSFLLSDLLCKNARLTSRFLPTHNTFRAVNVITPSMFEGINGRLSLALQNISECSLKRLMEMSGNRHRKCWTPRRTCWQDWNIWESLSVRNNIICTRLMVPMLPYWELACYIERRMKAAPAMGCLPVILNIWQVCI